MYPAVEEATSQDGFQFHQCMRERQKYNMVTSLNARWMLFLSKNKLKQGIACYIIMVGKIFLYGNKLFYNKSAYEYISSEKNIIHFKIAMEGHETARCNHTQI